MLHATTYRKAEMTTIPPCKNESSLHPSLSRTQALALIQEATSAKNLLRDCITSIRNMKYLANDADTTFTLGSIGVEKLLKLILGCNTIEESGQWPSKHTLSRDWGHDIENLNERINTIISDSLHSGRSSNYTQELATKITTSSIIPLLFKTLACYGNSGRFYYLDILATGNNRDREAPLKLWEDLEDHITSTIDEFKQIPTENAEIDDYVKRTNNWIADELSNWWYSIYRLAQNDYFGTVAKTMAPQLWDPDQHNPNT